MKKLFSRDNPDQRADYLRQQRSKSSRVPVKPTTLSQVMPPLRVTPLVDNQRSGDPADAHYNQIHTGGNSRPSMMKLVYPPLKESELRDSQGSDKKYHRATPQPLAAISKLVARVTGDKKAGNAKRPPAQQQAAAMPRSIYINPHLIVRQPEARKRSLRELNLVWRALSLILAGSLSYFIYFMWTSPFFKITTPSISGNVRVDTGGFTQTMAVDGKPSFTIVPSEIKDMLLNTYPEVSSIDLDFRFPNKLSLAVTEREPVLIWKQGGQTMWIDLFGIPMVPRGQPGSWYVVTAEGGTIAPVAIDPINHPGLYKPVADPELILTILNLANMTPTGTPIAYDPRYGLGWNDPQGWKVYFGFNMDGMESKLAQYAGIVTNLNNQSIQPKIISVQYPYAPFYRLEQ